LGGKVLIGAAGSGPLKWRGETANNFPNGPKLFVVAVSSRNVAGSNYVRGSNSGDILYSGQLFFILFNIEFLQIASRNEPLSIQKQKFIFSNGFQTIITAL